MKGLKEKGEQLIQNLINQGYLKTSRIIEVFRKTPRELFVPEKYKEYAYADEPLPIGSGQTISAPHMNAICTELLKPKKTDKILEIGSGSGYQAALLSQLAKKVITVELEKELAGLAKKNLSRAGIKNVIVLQGDGSKGCPEEKPYDKIIITCACNKIPENLIEQLKTGGIIIAPVGETLQTLTLGLKTKTGLKKTCHGGCVFVPLRH